MINRILEKKETYANACVYVDYENIFQLLKKYGTNPMQIEFFTKIKNRLRNNLQLNIIDFIVFGNFERSQLFESNHQTRLQSMGVQTRHTSNNGKNSGDLELTVYALTTLYKNKNVDVFVIISSDRDIIPLIKAIKAENKISYVITTKNGFDRIVAEYADFHEYIEDIFGLTEDMVIENSTDKLLDYHFDTLTHEQIERAKEVSRFFYHSKIWEHYITDGVKVSLSGYAPMLTTVTSRLKEEIIDDFKVAHYLKYVTLYEDEQKGICIKEGENRSEIE